MTTAPTVNLYDSSERAYAAKMSQFASQPLARSKRRRSSVGSNVSSVHQQQQQARSSSLSGAAEHVKQASRQADSAVSVAKPRAHPGKPVAGVKSTKPAPSAEQHAQAEKGTGARGARGGAGSVGVGAVGLQVRHASGSAGSFHAANLLQYSTATCWQSFSRAKETIVLVLDSKTLLSEIHILNKNACAVDVSIAMEDRPRSYVNVKRMQTMPHSREVVIKIGFIPCRFIRLEFIRHSHASIAVHGVMALGVPCHEIEDGSGPSLCNLLSHATENLLFGSSLRASQPYMDFLSEHRSGSPEWMLQHRTHLLDERIARLEAALFA